MARTSAGKGSSKSAHVFAQVPKAEIPRSTFDRSHGHKTAFNAGFLIPILVDEALPGDTFTVNMNILSRLSTPIFPIMDNMFLDSQFFAVPIRLLWSNWQKFNGEQANPGDSTSFVLPTCPAPAGGFAVGSLQDYMGIPTGITGFSYVSLFQRAYNLVYNQWYRDENLVNSAVVDTGDGPDDPANYVLRRRGKRHDYFTSCLPTPQKGPSVLVPIGSSAPVSVSSAVEIPSGSLGILRSDLTSQAVVSTNPPSADNVAIALTGTADLAQAVGATINQLRQSFQIQKLLERDARGGTRYVEIIKAHFGVTSPDARMQRPEFLGGGSTPIIISPVPQTSNTPVSGSPQGNLAAFGTAVGGGHGFSKSFTEHCIIIGIVSVRADLTYQQGLNRMYSRSTRYDFYWPALSHIGEQAVLRKEIYTTGVPAENDTVFGYQERHAEYRYKPSLVTGIFRSQAAGTLHAWHLAQFFSAAPTLSQTFIEENPPVDRIVAVPSQPHFIFDSYIQMRCARPMPVYAVPGLIDHF